MSSKKVTSSNNRFIDILFKSRETILNQLAKRGFITDDYDGNSINQIDILFKNNQLDMIFENKHDDAITPIEKVYVAYKLDKTLKPDAFRDLVYKTYGNDVTGVAGILNHHTDQLIIIVKDEPNATLLDECSKMFINEKKFVTLLNVHRLLFDITEHVMVPEHIPLSDEATTEFMRNNGTSAENYPEISRYDPVALAIGLKPGQLCEINRFSKTAIKSKYYRICVEN